ncbi:isocitrate dehydrogenase [Deinococcus koreensis]|uniref:Isocitrate dehydrogenase [NADP] n=2 Tax=Deinococcus koreensis TaxID=2054903 RepID=A0A2K3USS1_9DEIO|nr:isocitrate dehydrogenase [Deinococcus koreensis]
MTVPITVAYGDGIGPSLMEATLRILKAAGAALAPEVIEIGESVYRQGVSSGIEARSWESLRRTGVLLKAPITTPQGGGYKSLNVTLRKTLGLYANVRPCRAYAPYVPTLHPALDLVIIRENEEDLYAGIEHRQTREVVQCLKLITREGCERIVRYAFEYARLHGRHKVTALSKDNIMKMTDGLFHQVFDEIGAQYPELEREHQIIDIGTARVAVHPERYDVIVTLNLYGDILSDVAAEVAGSVGLAGSANIGEGVAMFEAIHGSAPDLAGQDVANPSGLLQAAVLMLQHLGQGAVATRIDNAWRRTLEDGVHTADIRGEHTRELVGTQAFADAVIERLGQRPEVLPVALASPPRAALAPVPELPTPAPQLKVLVGADIFFEWSEEGRDPARLAAILQGVQHSDLTLRMITNRGVMVWPGGFPETRKADHWRCRFLGNGPVDHLQVIELLQRLNLTGLDFIKTEHLYTFDGVPGYSMGQGQ